MDFFFFVGLALISMHEMDAIRCREWRIFPGLSLLDDRTGFLVFMIAHVPLFSAVFWFTVHGTAQRSFSVGFDIFLLVHLVAHLLFLKHKRNEFRDWLSWSIIIGAGICGFVDLFVR